MQWRMHLTALGDTNQGTACRQAVQACGKPFAAQHVVSESDRLPAERGSHAVRSTPGRRRPGALHAQPPAQLQRTSLGALMPQPARRQGACGCSQTLPGQRANDWTCMMQTITCTSGGPPECPARLLLLRAAADGGRAGPAARRSPRSHPPFATLSAFCAAQAASLALNHGIASSRHRRIPRALRRAAFHLRQARSGARQGEQLCSLSRPIP